MYPVKIRDALETFCPIYAIRLVLDIYGQLMTKDLPTPLKRQQYYTAETGTLHKDGLYFVNVSIIITLVWRMKIVGVCACAHFLCVSKMVASHIAKFVTCLS